MAAPTAIAATGPSPGSARTWPPRCRPCLTSRSSWWAIRWAARWRSKPRALLKGRVIGIIGVDTFKSIGAPAPGKAQVDALIKPFEADFIGQTRTLVTEHLFVKGANPQLAQKIAYDMSLSPPRVGVPSLRALLEYDFTEPLKDISVPIVAINSDLGEPVNEARIRKVLPKFRAVTLAGDGHFLMMEDPQRFNPALEAEISTLVGARE